VLPVRSLIIKNDKTAQVLSAIQEMAGKHVVVGIPAEKGERKDDENTNAEIGYINEFGSPANYIPARPFLIPGVKQVSEKCADALGKFAKGGFTDSTAIDKGLNAAGLIAVAAVKNRIKASEGFAPLSDRTLAKRKKAGFSGTKPLIRTGQLLNSITYGVRKNRARQVRKWR
jgi:phage gpG-like protein